MNLKNIIIEYARLNFNRCSKISYSQSGEDAIVDFIVSSQKTGRYMDIGAHSPFFLNNTFLFYKRGWKGINVEPVKANIDLFNSFRPKDINVWAGIGQCTEMKRLHVFEPSTLSTFDEDVAQEHVRLNYKKKEMIDTQVYSVSDFISKYHIKNNIDIMSIDTEGGELGIINDFFKYGIHPNILICETAHHSPELKKATKNNDVIHSICNMDYILYADTFVNSIFVSKEFWEN